MSSSSWSAVLDAQSDGSAEGGRPEKKKLKES